MTTTPIIPLADLIVELRTQPTTIAAQTAADRLEVVARILDGVMASIPTIDRAVPWDALARIREVVR